MRIVQRLSTKRSGPCTPRARGEQHNDKNGKKKRDLFDDVVPRLLLFVPNAVVVMVYVCRSFLGTAERSGVEGRNVHKLWDTTHGCRASQQQIGGRRDNAENRATV